MKVAQIGLFAVPLVCVGSAQASTLVIQPAYFELSAQGAASVSTQPGENSGTGFSPGPEGGTEYSESDLAYGPPGDVNEYVTGTTVGGPSVANSNTVSYADIYYELLGPANVAVPLILTAQSIGNYAPEASGPDAIAQGSVQWAGGAFYDCAATGPEIAGCGSEPRSFSGSQTSDAFADIEYSLVVEVTGHSTGGTGGYYAGIDPLIQIDPNFPEAREFSLVFSPTSSVPEPSTWALMLLGFAGLGLACHRRRLTGFAVSV